MSAAERRITPADIASPDIYARERVARRQALIPVKKTRRVEVGPFATFHFESFDTMLAQVQEMLHIEKGGEEQIADELEAYNPLIPQGSELIATLMLEIEDDSRREALLRGLGGIETTISLAIGNSRIDATPTEYEDRTTPDGKTSSVHWLRFSFSPEQIAAFKNGAAPVTLGISHENYTHMAGIGHAVRNELAKDFDESVPG